MFGTIAANLDAMNVSESDEDYFKGMTINLTTKRKNYNGLTVPAGALYGFFNGNHIFILMDYLQFSRHSDEYWVLISSSVYDYVWEYPFSADSIFLNKIIDYIDEHGLYDQKVEDITLLESLREDTKRGKVKSYKSVRHDYYDKHWFFRV